MKKEMKKEMRLIDANALLRSEVKRCRCIPTIGSGYSNETSFKLILDEAPTVDAVEVVYAKWEEIGVADYKCSRCGFRFTSGDPISMFQYCRCGAKMDGGNEDV